MKPEDIEAAFFFHACEDHRDHYQRIVAAAQLFYMTAFGAHNEDFTKEQYLAIKEAVDGAMEMIEALLPDEDK